MIVAHNKDEETFTQLLSKSISQLEKESSARAEYYLNRGGVDFEKDVYGFVNDNAKNTVFEGNIELFHSFCQCFCQRKSLLLLLGSKQKLVALHSAFLYTHSCHQT
jgi:hypothetical protein